MIDDLPEGCRGGRPCSKCENLCPEMQASNTRDPRDSEYRAVIEAARRLHHCLEVGDRSNANGWGSGDEEVQRAVLKRALELSQQITAGITELLKK